MEDEPIYFINQYSFLKRPKVWSKREYWTFQAVSSIICLPLLVVVLMIVGPPFFTAVIIIIASSLGAAVGFRQGRRRAERYKAELALGMHTPYYGKYGLEETRFFMGR